MQDRQVNVRVVAASNRDLEAMVQAGKFRSDLLYRLRVLQINIPPLRSRGDDSLLLAQRFVALFAKRYAKAAPLLEASAQQALRSHDWPGNVRELRNAIERAVLLCHGGSLNATDLALGLRSGQRTATALPEAGTPLSQDELERQHLVQALAQTEWNVTRAARLLDVSRDTLRYRMERHGLQRPAASASASASAS